MVVVVVVYLLLLSLLCGWAFLCVQEVEGNKGNEKFVAVNLRWWLLLLLLCYRGKHTSSASSMLNNLVFN